MKQNAESASAIRRRAVSRAEATAREGKIREAVGEYRRLAEEYPDDWSIPNGLGDLLAGQARYVEAGEAYGQAADQLGRDGFWQKAAAIYRKGLKLVPGAPRLVLGLAEVLVAQGLTGAARTELLAARERCRAGGDEASATALTARLEALDQRQASRPKPTPPDPPVAREAPGAGTRPPSAPAAPAPLEPAPEGSQRSEPANGTAGTAPRPTAGASGPSGSAAAMSIDDVFREIRRSGPRSLSEESVDERIRIARTYAAAGLTDEALTALMALVEAGVSRFEVFAEIGSLTARGGRPSDAVAWWRRALGCDAPALDPVCAVLYDLGDALERTAQQAEALDAFLRLSALDPDYRDVVERLDRLASAGP